MEVWYAPNQVHYPEVTRGTFASDCLGVRATNILRMFGANTDDDAIEIIRHRLADIKKMDNCGKKTVKELKDWSYEAVAERTETEAVAGLVAAGISEKQAQEVIKAIVGGLVKHVSITY